MLHSLKDSIIFTLCLIVDCHDSTNAESRNDRVESFRSARLWIASSLAPLIPRNDKAES